MGVICWLNGHRWRTKHREEIPPIDDGGWGFHWMTDPIARLYQSCDRCEKRRTQLEYPPAADSNEYRWMRGEEPTIEPVSAPPNPVPASDSGSTSITTLASRTEDQK